MKNLKNNKFLIKRIEKKYINYIEKDLSSSFFFLFLFSSFITDSFYLNYLNNKTITSKSKATPAKIHFLGGYLFAFVFNYA